MAELAEYAAAAARSLLQYALTFFRMVFRIAHPEDGGRKTKAGPMLGGVEA